MNAGWLWRERNTGQSSEIIPSIPPGGDRDTVSLCVCQSAPVRALVVPVCCERGLYFITTSFALVLGLLKGILTT